MMNFRKIAAASKGRLLLRYFTEDTPEPIHPPTLDAAGRQLEEGGRLTAYYTGRDSRATWRPDMPAILARTIGIDPHAMPRDAEMSRLFEGRRADNGKAWGQPALQVIEKRLGLPVDANLSLVATLGQKTGDRYAPYSEKNYVNRLILSGSRDRGSILLFEPDFPLGTSVQIMTRNDETMFSSVHQGVREINQVIAHSQCLLGLYIDCAGRAALHSGTRIEEADVVRSDMDVRAPLMGFYSGVEIAPFNGSPRALDWTGVLVAIRRA